MASSSRKWVQVTGFPPLTSHGFCREPARTRRPQWQLYHAGVESLPGISLGQAWPCVRPRVLPHWAPGAGHRGRRGVSEAPSTGLGGVRFMVLQGQDRPVGGTEGSRDGRGSGPAAGREGLLWTGHWPPPGLVDVPGTRGSKAGLVSEGGRKSRSDTNPSRIGPAWIDPDLRGARSHLCLWCPGGRSLGEGAFIHSFSSWPIQSPISLIQEAFRGLSWWSSG